MADYINNEITASALIASSAIEDTPVYSHNGEKIGKIYNFIVDKYTGHIVYAVMSGGGFLGVGEHYYPIPWRSLSFVETPQSFVANITKDNFAKAPKYERGFGPVYGSAYRIMVDDFYGLPR